MPNKISRGAVASDPLASASSLGDPGDVLVVPQASRRSAQERPSNPLGMSAMALDRNAIEASRDVSTATVTTVLLEKGLRNVWMRGPKPLKPGQPRVAGPAFTLRFVPAREDLATPASWASPIAIWAAIEAMQEGTVAVIEAMGVADAGVFGDILCARMARRGGGAVLPDDVVVVDEDGAVIIAAGFVSEVLAEAPEQERTEAWMEEIGRDVPLPGLYPMNAETKAHYEISKAQKA